MTIEELIEELQNYPPETIVRVDCNSFVWLDYNPDQGTLDLFVVEDD